MNLHRICGAVLALLAWQGAHAVGSHDLELMIDVPPGGDLVRIELPEAVYRSAHRADLGDLRVVNGAGEVLPMARLPQPRVSGAARATRTPLPLPATVAGEAAALSVRSRAGGQAVDIDIRSSAPTSTPSPPSPGFVIDTEGFDRPVDAIELKWQGAPVFEAALAVSVSADLKDWRQVVRSAPVMALGEAELRLEQARVRLPAIKARYLRLTWRGTPPEVQVLGVDLVHEGAAPQPIANSIELAGTEKDGQLLFTSPGVFPVAGVSLTLADGTHVLSGTVSSRARPTDPWRVRGRLLAYRLQVDGTVSQNDFRALGLVRDPLWKLTVDGGLPEARPMLRLGWRTEAMVFVARGQGPYRLLVGKAGEEATWQPAAVLIPGYGTPAQIRLVTAAVQSPAGPLKGRPQALSWRDDPRQWLFWGVLLAGVVLLGWMARSLIRELGSGEGSDMR